MTEHWQLAPDWYQAMWAEDMAAAFTEIEERRKAAEAEKAKPKRKRSGSSGSARPAGGAGRRPRTEQA
jgi:hypothetical protein